MLFLLAKPESHMSWGNLFYNAPEKSEIDKAYEELVDLCLKRAEAEFPRHPDYPERNKMIPQVIKELQAIRDTESAFSFLVMCEIASLSREQGYPTAMNGMSGGLIVSYLLGISNIHPAQFDYSTVPSDMAVDKAYVDESFVLSLAIAEPIRKLIQHRLDQCFIKAKYQKELYLCIDLPDWQMLESIGKLAAKTGEDFNKVSLENPKLIETINMDICKTRFHCEPYYPAPQTPLELARVYAYAMCAADSKDHFERVKDYVFRDDIYRELAKNKDLVIDEIMSLIRNWSKGDEKANDIRLLYEYDIDKKVIAVYRELYNQWDAADCLARVNAMILLKHYQN